MVKTFTIVATTLQLLDSKSECHFNTCCLLIIRCYYIISYESVYVFLLCFQLNASILYYINSVSMYVILSEGTVLVIPCF